MTTKIKTHRILAWACVLALTPLLANAQPVAPGDVVYGMDTGLIDLVVPPGIWSGMWQLHFTGHAAEFTEFDNTPGLPNDVLHDVRGNLLGLRSSPPEIFNIETAAGGVYTRLFTFPWGLLPPPTSSTCGLSVSWANTAVAFMGDNNTLYGLEYNTTPGTRGNGSGFPDTWFTAGAGDWMPLAPHGSPGEWQGTTWREGPPLSIGSVIVAALPSDPNLVELLTVDAFPGPTFVAPVLQQTIMLPVPHTPPRYSDVEYNPTVLRRIFVLVGSDTGPTNTLIAVDPKTWAVLAVQPLGLPAAGREIALGPDGFIYIALASGVREVWRVDTKNLPAGATRYYAGILPMPTHAGLDVAMPPCCKGDIDYDGWVDFGDINPFVAVLLSGSLPIPAEACCNCDINSDGWIDFGDINPFVDKMLASPMMCP